MAEKTYRIDRKGAARLLKVSVRTVDRYIAANRLSIEKRDARIWLNRKEIVDFRKKKQVDSQNVDLSIDYGDSHKVDMGAADVDVLSTSAAENIAKSKQKTAGSVYKKLYEETHVELKKAQDRLEGANYRVGQLEALVSKSVPLLDHQRLLGEEKAQNLELEEKVETLRDRIEIFKQKLKDEKFSRKVYLVALFIILLLQPLWLFFVN